MNRPLLFSTLLRLGIRQIKRCQTKRCRPKLPRIKLHLLVLVSFGLPLQLAAAPQTTCKATVYLTLDTGNMRDAQAISDTLRKHQIKATFFVANELSWPDRKTSALEAQWAEFWKARVVEGHDFGSHTWRHGLFSKDVKDGKVNYRPQFGDQAGQSLQLNSRQVCDEIRLADTRFTELTGRKLNAVWRAAGGRTTPNTIAAATACGYSHVHWAPAGFLGDELPSEKYPNKLLLDRALRTISDQDILMGHLGIWSRKERFNTIFEPLIVGLKDRGFCFATITQHPQYSHAIIQPNR